MSDSPSVAGIPLLINVFRVQCFSCTTACQMPQGKKNILTQGDFAQHLDNIGWKRGSNHRYICSYCYAQLNNDTDRL